MLRNVLARLAGDGLVELQPHRGARVREVSVAEAIEITEIRRAVEGMVAARAAERITDPEIGDLRRLGEEMDVIEAVCARDPDKAELAMRAHLTSVLDTLRTFVAH